MKSWIVIPAMGVVLAAPAVALAGPVAGCAAGLAAAAFAAAVRALAGDGPAAIVAAGLAPLLAIAALAEHHLIDAHACTGLAAIAWTIALLARPTANPLVAMLPALVAGILEPAAIVLVPIAGTRLVTAPWQRPRWPIAGTLPASSRRPLWAIAVPIAGGLAVMLAAIAGGAVDGAFGALGVHWYGGPPQSITAPVLAAAVGDALGPLAAVAALAGIVLVARLRLAELAVTSCAIGALLVDLRAGSVGPSTLGVAALCAALAIGRLAAMIRMRSIQAVAAATAAALLLVPPAWIVIEHVR